MKRRTESAGELSEEECKRGGQEIVKEKEKEEK